MKKYNLFALMAASAMVASIAFAPSSSAQTGGNSFTIEETGQSFGTLQAAVDAVGARTATISIAPGTYRQCAVQKAGVITYAAQEYGTAVLSGTACEGKAALVLRGQGAEIRGLTFTGISVSDGNGAGVRLEKSNLNIAFTRFLDSQQGILTANDANGRIFITRSTFSRLGTCENSAGCAHSIYVGKYGSLTVTQSRFERGTGGHYVKSRAPNNVIENNSFDDAQGRATNYMIDLPNGSVGSIANNWFIQGRDKENYSALIALGAKGTQNSSDGLVVRGNQARFVPGLTRKTAFLADWSGGRIVMEGNSLAPGIEKFDAR